jgi:hypothetical protein
MKAIFIRNGTDIQPGLQGFGFCGTIGSDVRAGRECSALLKDDRSADGSIGSFEVSYVGDIIPRA